MDRADVDPSAGGAGRGRALRARQLDAVTAVLTAPNPSPMTLTGTNSYLLGAPGRGELVVVDPGPDLPDHRRALERAARERGATLAAVVLTHQHRDHAAAAGWSADWGAPVYAFARAAGRAAHRAVRDGQVLDLAGLRLEVLHTPGHASDHVCLRVGSSGAVLSGDHVPGSGTTVVAWPDGDMADYLASLRRLGKLRPAVLYPGHGPVVDDPAAVIAGLLAHRRRREREVLAALAAGHRTPEEIVERVYRGIDPALLPAAARSVRAHLEKLVAEGAAGPDAHGGAGFHVRPRGR